MNRPVCLSLLCAGVLLAQTDSEKLASKTVPPVRVFQLPKRVSITSESPLSLNDALLMAITNNQDLQAARIETEEAGFRMSGARGVYDPVFNALTYFQKQTLPVSSTLNGSTTGSVLNRTFQTTPSVAGSVPFLGGSYEVDFSNQRYSTNNTFAILNPSYPTALSFLYTQPLWRNLRFDANRYAIEVARKNLSLSKVQLEQSVIQVIHGTEQAYWELVFARSDLDVQLKALDVAHKQDESNRRQLESGRLAPIEIVAAQTQMANFEIAVYAAQEALTRAENNLKEVMLGDRFAPLWSTGLVPTTETETDLTDVSLADSITDAISARPEPAEIRISDELNQTAQHLNREQLKPQIDLVASYSMTGLAGTQAPTNNTNPLEESLTPALIRVNELSALAGLPPITLAQGATTPANLIGGYSDSLSNLINNNYPTWELQLRMSIPIVNRAGKADLALSMAESRRIEHRKKAVEQSIEAEVRNALQSVDSAKLRLESARVKSRSAAEQFESEDRQFRGGTSTLFLVQQRQLAVVTAMSQANRAQADLNQAISSFELACGSNYKRHNITVK